MSVKMFLRHREDGEIMYYDERLANHPKLEVVTEQQAYPERFAPQAVAVRLHSDTPPAVNLEVPTSVIEAPKEISPELIAEASTPFGRGSSITANPALAGLLESI